MHEHGISIAAAADPDFQAWFSGSVVHRNGIPLIAWRGEHGPSSAGFSTKHGSLSFGTRETACLYATNPNDFRMSVVAPRLFPCFLRITRPVMNDVDDPFMDLSHLIRSLGRETATEIALRHAERIVGTGNWEENFQEEWNADVAGLLRARPAALDELYLVAHVVMDDHDVCRRLARAGYDGAVCGGWGENACEPEWRLIDPAGALPALCWRSRIPQLRLAA